jgi:poly(A) polymerase
MTEEIDSFPPPVIIPRGKHSISRKLIDAEALKVLYRLRRFGYVSYLVGGGVRDILLGKNPKDFDIATNARPSEIRKLFRNSRAIGRRFRLVQVFFSGGKIVEVATFRRQSEFDQLDIDDAAPVDDEADDPTRPQNSFGTPAEDAFRRDITINGLFYNVDDFTIVDYVGGLEDLKKGIVRSIGAPRERFLEDPVRMIRVIRHAARTGFAIDPDTYQAVLELQGEITTCPQARVRDEFLRDLGSGSAGPAMKLMMETGIIYSLYPEYRDCLGDGTCPEAEEYRGYMLRLMEVLDRAMTGPNPPGRATMLATFLLPMFGSLVDSTPQQPGVRLSTFLNRLGMDRLKPLLMRWSFFKRDAEIVRQILSAQPQLRRAVSRGSLPGSLTGKMYFEPALILYQIEAATRGEAVPPLLHQTRPDLHWPLDAPRQRRNRRRSKARRRPAGKSD